MFDLNEPLMHMDTYCHLYEDELDSVVELRDVDCRECRRRIVGQLSWDSAVEAWESQISDLETLKRIR